MKPRTCRPKIPPILASILLPESFWCNPRELFIPRIISSFLFNGDLIGPSSVSTSAVFTVFLKVFMKISPPRAFVSSRRVT